MPTAPTDTIETILNAARTRLNDAIASLAGDVLTDNQPFTTQMVNNAWRRMQRTLAAQGYLILVEETIITAFPAGSSDPGAFSWIDWTGYFNGTSFTPSGTICLPQDFIEPLRLWERATGTSNPFDDMDEILNGIPAIPKQDWNALWEWRQNRVYLLGANAAADLRLRYQSYFPDFTDISASGGSAQTIPIIQCQDPFSWYICSEMASSRGDLDAKSFDAMADAAATMIAQRNSQEPRSIAKNSQYGAMRDARTPSAQPTPALPPQPGGAQ